MLQTSPDQAEKIAKYFYERTRELIISKSFAVSGQGVKTVDIVRDVLRYVPLYWAATELVCQSDIVYSDVADGRLNYGNRLA